MEYKGSCHCGSISFEVQGEIEVINECNCSHCHKKGFLLWFIKKKEFKLVSGEENLTNYYFNKKSLKHSFCSICGSQAFASVIEGEDMAINVRCLDNFDTKLVPVNYINGKDF